MSSRLNVRVRWLPLDGMGPRRSRHYKQQAVPLELQTHRPQAIINIYLPGIPVKQVTHREANERHERRPESKISSTFCCIISSSRLLTQRLVQLHLAEHLEHLGVRSAAGA